MRRVTLICSVLLWCAPSVVFSQERMYPPPPVSAPIEGWIDIGPPSQADPYDLRPRADELPPPEGSPPISTPPPNPPKMKVKCKVGSDEVATGPLNGNLLTGKDYDGPDTVRVGSQGQNKKLWGNMSRQKDDHNCPAVMGLMGPGIASLMGGNQVSELFCISARGIVSVQFSSTRVGDCKICDTAGNCHAP